MQQKKTRNVALKSAIFASGRTQRDLAAKTQIGEVRFSKIVNGKVPPSVDERNAIAAELGEPPQAFFPDESPSTSQELAS